ncbi:cellulase family glycosylhydrolase [Marinilabilia salmonicolor]|uniref:cellulase family glycosylhydrolase n=1 Tax=Marinilabilia salmonicolor TaxID=989 RepID=UPI0011E05439|nr:cellulase family glycosylhydrolase [Marinilabilia salmonicolor]
MKKKRTTILIFLAIAMILYFTNSESTMTVNGRHLFDANGEQVVLRGVNEMFIWSDDPTGDTLMTEIAQTGANSVRIVWLSNEDDSIATAENLDKVIQNAINNGMFPMPELHGATGDFEKLQSQVDYWLKPKIVKVLRKHEPYLLLNIANECGGHDVKAPEFLEGYKTAISRIRKTGLRCPLVIDASGWGQDIDILMETGPELLKHDPETNLLFSVHIWWPADHGSTERIKTGLQKAVDMDLPLIVGEFAPMGVGCKEWIDYETIMKECQKHQIGWLAWSWGDVRNGDCSLMDMTRGEKRGTYEGLTDWGLEATVTLPMSIQNTSVRTEFLKDKMSGN